MSEFTARYLSDYQPSPFTIDEINLTFALDKNKTRVTSVLSVKRQHENGTDLVLDGEHLTLISVAIDERTLSPSEYEITETNLTLRSVADNFSLTMVTEIDPAGNTALEGLYQSGKAYCTQCEAEGFRRITYYLDRPDVMAVFTTKVIGDKESLPYLLANGNPIERGELENGQHFVTWHDPFPKPAYLFALVAGDFDLLKETYTTASGREVSLEIFVDKGNKHKVKHAMASLHKSMRWDEEVFGLEYDLDIYMIVAVDFFNMGAMENKGLNVFNSKYVLADENSATDTDFFNIEAVIAHEYFHNWTGNRVTCRDWFQLSLKEGLTVFRDQQFSADMHSAGVTRIQNVKVLRSQQFAEDAGPMSHPIRPEKVMEMNNFYTLTVYEKGSEVIRMLHTLLGQEGFRKGMDLYFKRFDGMAVTCDDFVNAMADANDKDLTLFKRWYSQSGTPELTVNQSFNSAQGKLTLTVTQCTPRSSSQPEKLPLHIPINIELIDTEANTSLQQLIELTSERQTWEFDATENTVIAFLGGFSAPVKVDFEQSEKELLAVIANSQDSFCVWDAGQTLMANEIKRLIENGGKVSTQVIDMFSALFKAEYDAAFRALMLTLPSFDEMVSQIDNVTPHKLLAAISSMKHGIAQHFQAELENLYLDNQSLAGKESSEQVGARALANTCLSYLAALGANDLIQDRYAGATDMTTKLGALQSAVKYDVMLADSLLEKFELEFTQDTLVMDKWFSLQANVQSDDMFERLTSLMKRDDFSLKNPNRARALIGAFVMQNANYFHRNDGAGYRFLADNIIEMDKLNPQVASRLITPLIQFKAFDSHHQTLMVSELKRISTQSNLSRDLVEKLEAALSEAKLGGV
ncbi:MAG: aminopeptidase N [Thalassotalea sp.]|nr:aminopeptidase N [Thalassotalea sp.]